MYSMREICQAGEPGYQLIGEQQHCLERKLARAKVEQVLERRAQQVQNHAVAAVLHAKPPQKGDTHSQAQKTLYLRRPGLCTPVLRILAAGAWP